MSPPNHLSRPCNTYSLSGVEQIVHRGNYLFCMISSLASFYRQHTQPMPAVPVLLGQNARPSSSISAADKCAKKACHLNSLLTCRARRGLQARCRQPRCVRSLLNGPWRIKQFCSVFTVFGKSDQSTNVISTQQSRKVS